jgi:hypothetical protein
MSLTRALLRRRLIRTAKRGLYDPRMCAYYGVDPDVNAGCRAFIRRGYAQGLVPTSTTGGTHAPGSFHKQKNALGEGRAVDMGLIESEIGTARGRRRMVAFQVAEHEAHRDGRRTHMAELIGPDNRAVILRKSETDLAEGTPLETQHDNHVHGAFEG